MTCYHLYTINSNFPHTGYIPSRRVFLFYTLYFLRKPNHIEYNIVAVVQNVMANIILYS